MAAGLAEELAQLAGKRVLLTGGAGFLGYYLAQLPLYWNDTCAGGRKKIQVVLADNFIRGVPSWLQQLQGRSDLQTLRHDICRPLAESVGDFEYVIHAASIASPTFYRQHPIETIDANVIGLRLMLDRAVGQKKRGTPVEGLLFFSSSEIYGDPAAEWIPTPEHYWGNVSCTGPRACYDESKRFGETLSVNFVRVHEVPVRIARPFNNYGPGLKLSDRRVIPDICRDIIAGRDIVLFSDGTPTRTFCYVADAVIGYYKILVRGRDGEAYNIGTESPEISMTQLAEKLRAVAAKVSGYGGKVVHQHSGDKEYLVHNPNRRCPVITKAREHLAYHPSVDVDEGLERSFRWYLENREGGDA